ncbi:MATE family efflux transporter [Mycobacterium intracellulare]|uniref:MATE family efflux transporter n=1 Tax=Mycobacterium intracellulare subsp. chimaera TaxID=222805 RepID=A0ABT7P8M2_MYCIT|nr:MATE family efflux transporter [Mycobacterium intracellulare]AOS92127.1 MATE family efflux transporter [Mycobacterium intracellulare subsp. chimaera]ASL09460.1 putative efflux protein, MATE family [Mycobacterium intracellulare subsp. chimaera]ASL21265.1 putative efflux protein, MATE family [Mycobacterium intracellulare subsp. chimaera]KPN44839.1 MATE family efflux transporter [Mycobacterium intracellulare subsp. chimaera]KPN48505.1 MATE family efflux transporter [Mycobacterium intracellular
MDGGRPTGGRQIAALALPTLGVLAAEPLYVLFDFGVVGHLGALPLAGLAIGALVLGETQLTFLSYGTTARAARFFGSGDRAASVNEGTQATWLALAIGAVITFVVEAAGVPLVSVIASRGDIAEAALPWLRIAILGAPAILVSLAGNGWMRGVQDTMRPLRYVVAGFGLSALLCPLLVYGWLGLPRLELPGSAVANLAGQWLAALLFCRALLAERISLRVDRAVLRAQVVLGRDLFVRIVAFQVCFVSAAAVAARFGAAAVAAHQVVVQLWNFLALVLDSLAIAAQALVGAALGAGNAVHAKSVAWRITAFSLLAATVLALLLGAGAPVVPELFTHDQSVLNTIHVPWWFLAAQLPIAGMVWGLDGVLLGAGDAKFLRNATVIGALAGFLPLIWLSLVFGWGLAGIWSGLATFTVLRLVFVGARTLSGRWAVTGTG